MGSKYPTDQPPISCRNPEQSDTACLQKQNFNLVKVSVNLKKADNYENHAIYLPAFTNQESWSCRFLIPVTEFSLPAGFGSV